MPDIGDPTARDPFPFQEPPLSLSQLGWWNGDPRYLQRSIHYGIVGHAPLFLGMIHHDVDENRQ